MMEQSFVALDCPASTRVSRHAAWRSARDLQTLCDGCFNGPVRPSIRALAHHEHRPRRLRPLRGRTCRPSPPHRERSGLPESVVWLGPNTLKGVRDGVPISIRYNTAQPLPETVSEPEASHQEGTWLSVPSPGPELMVCRRDLTDCILGPLLGASRQRTGDVFFDTRFDVVVMGPGAESGIFPPAELRAPLAELGLQWLRRKDGQLEIMLGILGPNQMVAVAEVAVALSGAQTPQADRGHYRGTAPARAITIPPNALEHFKLRSLYAPLLLGFAVCVITAPLGGTLLPLTETAHEIFGDVACEAGFRPVQTRSEEPDGTYIGARCERPGAPSMPTRNFLNWACAALAMSPPLGLGLLFTLLLIQDRIRRAILRNRALSALRRAGA